MQRDPQHIITDELITIAEKMLKIVVNKAKQESPTKKPPKELRPIITEGMVTILEAYGRNIKSISPENIQKLPELKHFGNKIGERIKEKYPDIITEDDITEITII